MTFDELYSKILSILPDATIDEDLDGQLVIYTNKKEKDSVLVDYESRDL